MKRFTNNMAVNQSAVQKVSKQEAFRELQILSAPSVILREGGLQTLVHRKASTDGVALTGKKGKGHLKT